MFLDDPDEFIIPMETAWQRYIEETEQLELATENLVVEWKLANNTQYLPNHPFYRTIDTSESDGYWKPRPVRWADQVEADFDRVEHGFDKDQRLVFVRRGLISDIIIRSEGHFDFLRIHPDDKTESRIIGHQDKDGMRRGGFTRCFIDEKGRIVTKIRLSNEGSELGSHHRSAETFHWEGERLVESFRQSFDLGKELPVWAKHLPLEHTADMYLQTNERLRELKSSRACIRYSYNDAGRLIKAEKLDGFTGKHRNTLYSYNEADTIETVSAEFIKLLSKTLIKAINKQRDSHPIRRVALIYSAEHVHCGLPTQVLLASSKDGEMDSLDWEAYNQELEWPPTGRIETKIEDLLRRLLIVVESAPEFAEDYAPVPYRKVLWKTSQAIYQSLFKKKRIVTEDFAVFPIDDHGDVDSREDVRQSMPPEVAERVLQELSGF